MYCKHCGKEIDDNSQYCQHCGKLIVKESTSLASSKDNTESSSEVENKEKETSEDSTYFTISKFVGRMCMYVILLIVLFGILAAIKMLSKELFGNSFLFYSAISFLGAVVLYKAFKWYKTFSKEAKYFTIVVIIILVVSKIGYEVSDNIAEQRMIRNLPKPLTEIEKEEKKIDHINTKLPIDIDDKISWVKVEFETDSIYFEYLADDSSVDYEISILDFYQELFIKKFVMVSNKAFVEHFVEENKKLKFRIISQWDYTKHVDMSLTGVELDYVLKKINNDLYSN